MLKLKYLLLFCSYLFSIQGWAQAPSHRIISTVDRGDYEVIPLEVFRPDVVGVVQQEKFSQKAVNGQIPLTFSWFSICTDGSYTVTVTPEQVYLTTGHENPNPNYLYWVLSITTSQYEAIKQQVTSRCPAGFLDLSKYYQGSELAYKSQTVGLTYMQQGWSDKQYETYCATELTKQLFNIFTVLNSPFTKQILRRPKDTPRLISYLREEIIDWLPQRMPKK